MFLKSFRYTLKSLTAHRLRNKKYSKCAYFEIKCLVFTNNVNKVLVFNSVSRKRTYIGNIKLIQNQLFIIKSHFLVEH